MGMALLDLGYSVLGCRLDMVHPLQRGDVRSVLDVAGQFDAVQDVPWAALYRELDERYPGSRFILTEREEEEWLRSARRHFKDTEIPLHGWLYGEARMIGNEELYCRCYRRHNRRVREYFRGRSGDLLIMNLAKGDGWELLCEFLGHAVPSRPFPHANKGPQSYTAADKAKAGIRRLVPVRVRRAIFRLRQFARDLVGMPDPRNRFNNFEQNRRELAAQRFRSQRDR